MQNQYLYAIKTLFFSSSTYVIKFENFAYIGN